MSSINDNDDDGHLILISTSCSSANRWRGRIREHGRSAAATAGQSAGARKRVRFRFSLQRRHLPVGVARTVCQTTLWSLRLRRGVRSSFAPDETVQRRPVRGDGLSIATPGECDWSTSFERPVSYRAVARLCSLCVSEPSWSLGAFIKYFEWNSRLKRTIVINL